MANTKLSDISPGGRIALSTGGVQRKPALGDGTAKPGDSVGIVAATGKVVQTDVGVSELFEGFLEPNPSEDEDNADTAITDGVPCNIVIPESGKDYAVHIADPGAGVDPGQPYGLSATAGALAALATQNTAGVKCVMGDDGAVDDDTYAKIRWL